MKRPPAENPPAILRGVAVAGATTIDRNEVNAARFVKLGGVTTYAGLTYRRLGLETWVVSRVAAPDRPLLEVLQRQGIRLVVEESTATTSFVNRVSGGRRTQEMPAAAEPVGADRFQEVLGRVDCVHLGPLHPRDIDLRAISLVMDSGLLVVLDAQGYTRALDRGRVVPRVSEHLSAALEAAHVVKTGQAELEAILRGTGLALARLMADFKIREWVVTRGPRGGWVVDDQGAEHRYEAAAAPRPADPTGAGDVFLAAYVASRFAKRRSMAAACTSAARRAAELLAGRLIPPAWLDLTGRLDIP